MPHKTLGTGQVHRFGGFQRGNPSNKSAAEQKEELRKRIIGATSHLVSKPKKPLTQKRPKIQMTTLPAGKHPIDSKLLSFFKRNQSNTFKVKSEFLRAFEIETGIPVSTSELRLREFLRVGKIPQFARNKAGRKLGFNKKSTTGNPVGQQTQAQIQLRNNPLYIQARKFGRDALISAYKEELAKATPSKERIKEIESIFSLLNKNFDLEWLRKKARL
jgi:hypothetical protein